MITIMHCPSCLYTIKVGQNNNPRACHGRYCGAWFANERRNGQLTDLPASSPYLSGVQAVRLRRNRTPPHPLCRRAQRVERCIAGNTACARDAGKNPMPARSIHCARDVTAPRITEYICTYTDRTVNNWRPSLNVTTLVVGWTFFSSLKGNALVGVCALHKIRDSHGV